MKRTIRGFAGSLERSDLALLASVGVLIFFGIFVVYGAGSFSKLGTGSPLGHHLVIAKHLFMIGLGVIVMLVLMNVDYHWYRQNWLNIAAVVVTFALVAWTIYDADIIDGKRVINRWIRVGGFTFQPVEMAKIALILFMGHRLTARKNVENLAGRELLAILGAGPLPLIVLLVLQPNFGNILVVAGVTLIVLFASGTADRWLLRVMMVLPPGAVLAYFAITKIQTRVDNLREGLTGGSYGHQVDQSLIGLGAGGWLGLGIGQSHNKFAFLPESHTDFAFSLLGEEWGLFGTLTVTAMMVLFTWRGFSIAGRAADPFGRVLAAGLTTSIAIYGLVNLAMVTGIFPVVGVPLPFVSYGGTSMITSLAVVGILLNIERGSRSYNLWKQRWDRSGTV